MWTHKIFHVGLIVIIGLSIGCNRRPSDHQITKDIETKAGADSEIRDAKVQVESTNGKVVLQGTVPSSAARTQLEQIARQEPGVSDVDDETLIEPTTSETQPIAQQQNIRSNIVPLKQPPPPPPLPIVVPAGTVLIVRVGQTLSSKNSHAGQTFVATLAQPVSIGGKPALPAGSAVSGTVVNAKAKGKMKGEGQLDLALTNISVDHHTYPIQTTIVSTTVKGKGKRTAATTGGGAAGGALIGGIAGGGKGAGIGALVGAGAGLIGGAVTGNKQIDIPAESALTFTLSQSLTLQPQS